MNPVPVIATNIETGEEKRFASCKEAAATLGVWSSDIRKAINRAGTCHGYILRRVETPLPDRTTTRTNICFDCKKACGGCSWSARDPDTQKLKFEPVPGWTAKPTQLVNYAGRGEKYYDDTYEVTACPLFEPDDPRETDRKILTLEESDRFVENIRSILRKWEDD